MFEALLAFPGGSSLIEMQGIVTELATAPFTARSRVASASYGDKIYYYGGYVDGSDNYVNDFFSYDTITGEFETLPVTGLTKRAFATLTSDEAGNLFCIGGQNASTQYQTVYRYNIASRTWTSRTSFNAIYASMGHAAAYWDGTVWCLGGYNSSQGYVAQIRGAFTGSNNTTTVGVSVSPGRRYAPAIQLNGKIYYLGGYTTVGSAVVEEFTPPSMTRRTRANLPVANYSYDAWTMNGRIYTYGGIQTEGGTVIRNGRVYEYNPVTNTWRLLFDTGFQNEQMCINYVNGRVFMAFGYSEDLGGRHNKIFELT